MTINCRAWSAGLMCLLCAGCGSFHLDKGRTPPEGRTADQQTLDVLLCKDKAKTESQTAEKQARGFMLGLTLSVFGAAADYGIQKQDQREIYKACMEAKGYTNIIPATD